jgi:lipoprotein signal peptidase
LAVSENVPTFAADMNNWMYYVAALVAIVLAAWVIKKVTSCIVKTIAMAVIVAVLAYIYFFVING